MYDRKSENKYKVITALFSGTGYDARCPGELISELGKGLNKEKQTCLIFNGPGCENNIHLNTPVFWDPLPEINTAKKIFNFIRRAMDAIYGTSMEKIIDNAVTTISDAILANLNSDSIVINLGGWSRGAVASGIVAGKLAKKFPQIKINLAMVDPVSGSNHYSALKLPPQVKNLLVFYAQNETRSYMKPCNLVVEPTTKVRLIQTPGNHFSLVEPTYAPPTYEAQHEPKVVWKLFITFFKAMGSAIDTKKIQYYERINKTELQITPFTNKSLNDYETLNGLFAFKELNQRGKIRFTNGSYYHNNYKNELMRTLLPNIRQCIISKEDLNPVKTLAELNTLKDNHCWNILTSLKEVSKKGLPSSIEEFFNSHSLPTQTQIEELYYRKLNITNSQTKTMRLTDILPRDLKLDHCTNLHKVWSKTNNWKLGFQKLAHYYCQQGIFTWRHHRDIYLELLKFLESNFDLITPQLLIDHALVLINDKMHRTYRFIAKDGLLIQSLCYFRDRTKGIEDNKVHHSVVPLDDKTGDIIPTLRGIDIQPKLLAINL